MPINRKNPGLPPSPSRGGVKASPHPERGLHVSKHATNNRPSQPNRSNAAYNRADKEFNAPTSERHVKRGSYAHQNKSLEGIGGNHGGAIDDPTPPVRGGLDSKRASDIHCGAAKAKDNIRPDSAHEHSGFGNIGGCTKTNI